MWLTFTYCFFPIDQLKNEQSFGGKPHDIQLLTEVISVEPYRWKHGSREQGDAFRNIAVNFTEILNLLFRSKPQPTLSANQVF